MNKNPLLSEHNREWAKNFVASLDNGHAGRYHTDYRYYIKGWVNEKDEHKRKKLVKEVRESSAYSLNQPSAYVTCFDHSNVPFRYAHNPFTPGSAEHAAHEHEVRNRDAARE